ncbi:FHA domain-containing protein [Janthinobacterium sp. SUN176]|uniref:FHA domain-containing protein n=1 Tax=unclassified Janthinobacterium TaxID=2610881 RepID=UPI0025B12BB1|nr:MULTISPECIES: FHA domain-containing protein [unclassified Janthinobacterium]MDN2676960.1 FHA domain-containing protein [Janthinobacterium sp. SUN033]MDO8072265.1 FHA domain-containing protein [Janthinobacterium sp. SUN176]
MKAPYFIEILADNGEVRQRQRIATLPIRIGRGYDNDFILDDAHTAAAHAIVEDDGAGGLLLRDLGSQNGVIHRGQRQLQVAMTGNSIVRLGHTRLRVRASDHPVAPELGDTTRHDWEGLRPAIAGLAMIGASAAFSNWLSDADAFEPISYLMIIAYALAGGLVWASIWAVANRLFGHGARFGRHLFIIGCGLLAMEVWELGSNVTAYALSLEVLTRYGRHMFIVIVCAMIYYHLCTIKPQHPRRFGLVAVVLAIVGSTLILLSNLQASGRLADEAYMAVIYPPALRLSQDHTTDAFFRDAASLQRAVDAERGQAAKGADEDEDSGD